MKNEELLEYILSVVSESTGIAIDDIVGYVKRRDLGIARALVVNYLRKGNFTYKWIAERFNRHYSTIIHLQNEYYKMRERDKSFQEVDNEIKNKLKDCL